MFELLLGTMSDISNIEQPPMGTPIAGYWGIVEEEDFISASELITKIGLTAGTTVSTPKPAWLKFSSANKVIYMALRAFKHTLTWDSIYNRGAAFDVLGDQSKPAHLTEVVQNATVTIGDTIYRVRLPTDQEWTNLVYPLVNEWDPTVLQKMNIGNVTGAARWLLNVGRSSSYRRWRGWTSITATTADGTATNTAPSSSGWAPILEPIGKV